MLITLLCWVGTTANHAATVTLQHGVQGYTGSADAWLDEGYKTRNYGGSTSLRVQYNNGMSDCTLLRFELPALSFQSLTAATLGLYYYDQTSMQSDNAVWITPYRITNGMSWFENIYDGAAGYGVNWRYRDHAQTLPWTGQNAGWYDKIDDGNSTNKIKRPGGSVPDAIEPPNWVTWNVRNSVAQWYAGQDNNGFVLFESGFQGGGYLAAGLFYSRESSDPNLRPYLTLSFQGAHIGWRGFSTSVWDTNAINWNVGGARGRYGEGDFVTFADGANSATITVASGGVALGGVLISNHSLAYAFSGGSIGGSGGLTKTGAGQATLGAANTFTGPTLVQAGRLIVSANNALGSSAAGTVVSNGAALGLHNVSYTAAEPLTLAGAGVAGSGALYVASGNSSFAGPITLAADTLVGVPTAMTLSLGNAVTGAFGLIKGGAGTLTLAGDAANSYAGATRVNDGTLLLAKSAGHALPGALIIGDGTQPATVRLLNHGQINPASSVTLANAGTLDLNNFNGTVGSLALSNAMVLTGTGTLTLTGPMACAGNQTNLISGTLDLNAAVQTVTVADGAAADDLLVAASVGNGGLAKLGAGRLVLAGNNTFDRETVVAAGVLCAASDTALGKTTAPTIVSNGA
ncbi:MAG: autotransporter-associated beta strand repeat-containing protein, partial [Verrucomicrobiales bacterium]|nr:autotransporter-associated beta strand repeat-containing protein [Verrucomicrobiales bacterium]